MSKGKFLNLFAGIFDILLALSLIAVATLALAFNIEFINTLLGSMLLSSFIFLESIGLPVSGLNQIEILSYIFIGILSLVGLLSLIFGSVTVSKIRKKPETYHKLGSVITFFILEIIALTFFIILLVSAYSLGAVIATSALGTILVLRFVGILFISCERKRYLKETPIAS